MKPEGQRAQKHFFELTNFDRDLLKCFVCNKYILGLFYQGYKCSLCSSISHKDCLIKIKNVCSAVNRPPSLPNALSSNQIGPNPVITLGRSLSAKSQTSNQSVMASFCAKAIYKYDGRPAPLKSPRCYSTKAM